MTAKEGKIFASFDSFRNYISVISKRKSFRYGLPFILLVIGGSFGLREFAQVRYQFSQVKGVSREEAQKMGLNKTKNVTLEDTYEEIKNLDIDNWENKRGPRPWEEPTSQTKKEMKK
ncbi:cytochrome c oxidase assembly protein COX16 homolog, mitochondrial [Amyelois transitella]|uniref:cytochrome c oxidase assembly protein COX16 homolog, mitochondrial n=1 Tax=Amyelois transitella TaxID=680683 RepID=UPI00067D783D|nr:cytochrome c oxidase assembly protein COX16 homolog, mitochondrial [Amyelois transitella]